MLHLIVDQDEDAIAIQCPKCNEKRILLDCAEIWEDAEPKKLDCPVCGNDSYTSKAGLLRATHRPSRHVLQSFRISTDSLYYEFLLYNRILISVDAHTGEINDFDPWNSKDQRYLDSWVKPT